MLNIAQERGYFLNKVIITVGTVTFAVKCKRMLQRSGIKVKLVKVDPDITVGGCSYGLEILENDFFTVVRELKSNGINYRIYKGNKL